MASVASPCINVCQMSEATQLCMGCYRTVEEITRWCDMTPEEQRALLLELERRQTRITNFN